jgi:hypothetical protein
MQDIFVSCTDGLCFTMAENGEGTITLVWHDGHGFNLTLSQTDELCRKVHAWDLSRNGDQPLSTICAEHSDPCAERVMRIIEVLARKGHPVDSKPST